MLRVATRIGETTSEYINRTHWILSNGTMNIQIGRSVLALSQASILLFTSWEALTPSTIGNEEGGALCVGVGSWSLLCLGSSDATLSRGILILIFAAVISGVFPQVTAVLHAYASFSISTSIGLPDGGEQVAQIFSVLMVPLVFFLPLTNGWRKKPRRGEPGPTAWSGISVAVWTFVRLQFAFIYLQSGISKFATEDWLNGSAMYYVFRDASFGATGWLGEVALGISVNPLGVALISWGSIAVEIAIGLLLIVGRRLALRVAFIALALLHVGIIAFIGLWSFGLIMIAVGFIACIPLASREASSSALGPRESHAGMPSPESYRISSEASVRE